MSYLYEYMSADELEIAKEDAIIENASMKFDHAIKCLVMEHTIRISNIDTEALVQEYTNDDLESMYTAEMAIFTEGVKELWEKFKKFIASLVAKITGKKAPADVPPTEEKEKVELEYDPKEVENILDKVGNTMKKIVDIKKEDGSGIDPKKLGSRLGITIGAGVLGVGAVFLASKRKTIVEKGKVLGFIENLKNKVRGINDDIQGLENPEAAGSDTEKASKLSMLKDLATSALKWAGGVINSFMNAIKSIGKKDGASSDKAAGDGNKDEGNKSSEPKTLSEVITLLKADKSLKSAWSDLMTWDKTRGGNNIKGKINLSILKKSIDRAQDDGGFKGNADALSKIIEFIQQYHITESTSLGLTFEDLSTIIESASDNSFDAEIDCMAENTNFTESFNDLMELIDSL